MPNIKTLSIIKRLRSSAIHSVRQLAILCAVFAGPSLPVHATIVQFQTVKGNFEVNLLDDEAPITVQNFLDYVESGAYQNSIIHRSPVDFVVQGGSFTLSDEDSEFLLDDIPSAGPIDNEPMYSNTKGTISMARKPNEVNSATSSWFINAVDNSENLDYQNEGFTVFGYVISPGMEVVEAIDDLPKYSGPNFSNLPLIDYDLSADPAPLIKKENLVVITDIVIIDAEANTADGHNLNIIVEKPIPEENNSSEGAGSINIFMLALLCILGFSRVYLRQAGSRRSSSPHAKTQ